MSAITKFFGALIKAVAAIFGGIFGIFKQKNNGEFFLEIDPSKDSAAAPEPAPVAVAPAPVEAVVVPRQDDLKKGQKAQVSQATPATQAVSQPAAVALANQALNMPQPKVSTIEPLDIPKFGPARRPGANMKGFLDMAKTVKS